MNERIIKLNRIGWWIFIPFLILVVRLTWERTYLTLTNGQQNIGFSLAHGYFAILFLTPILSLIWTLMMLIQFVFRNKVEREKTDGRIWILLILMLATWGLFLIPWDTLVLNWERK
jgi:hypothetical protein